MPVRRLHHLPFRTMLAATWAVIAGLATTYAETMVILEALLVPGRPMTAAVATAVVGALLGAVLAVVGGALPFSRWAWAQYVCGGSFVGLAAITLPSVLAGGTAATVATALHLLAAAAVLLTPARRILAPSPETSGRSSAARFGISTDRDTPGRGP